MYDFKLLTHQNDILIRVNRVSVNLPVSILFFLTCLLCCKVNAEDYYWTVWFASDKHYSTAYEACAQFEIPGNGDVVAFEMYSSIAAYCKYYYVVGGSTETIWTGRYGDSCPSGTFSNDTVGECNNDQQKGAPPLDSCAGNPINVAVGNKFQQEVDFQSRRAGSLTFSRIYNSLDGVWRHSYSTYIRFVTGKLSLVHADGKESFFTLNGDVAIADLGEVGTLVKNGSNWLYTSDTNEQFTFDTAGRLTLWASPMGIKQTLTYFNGQITVTSDTGQTLSFTEDSQHQPLSLSAADLQITYHYDSSHHLIDLQRTHGTQTEQRIFHYEDSRNNSWLTGITDERGIRFATWTYDDQGRAISSQHSGGAGLTQVSYNADGSSTVTNELGKQTIYRYQQIGGVRRVVAIEGEPTLDCPASNSSYTYNDRGQVLTKTDAKGLVTTYIYNDRGLEISRTEAAGTSLARTITTEWDPTRFLPTQVKEPTRTTIYSYDDQGREINRQVRPTS